MTTATIPRQRLRGVSTGALVLTASSVLLLTGCGSSTSADSSAPADSAPSQQTANGAGGTRGTGGFVTGLIADVSGKTMQVQGTDAQTAVTYTAKTSFTQQVSTSASAIEVGTCVSVQTSGAASASTSVTATAVSVTAAVKGECTGRAGGSRGTGAPSGMPSGAPGGAPSGAPSGAPQGGTTPGGNADRTRPVSGKVATVDGSSFTVTSVAFGDTGSQTYVVTTSDKTTVTKDKTVTAKAVKTGLCTTAAGKTDSTGAVTATSVALRPAVDGACSAGFGRPSGQRSDG